MRWEKTGKRDLSYSLWHREALGDEITMIDLDSVEYCDKCLDPLAIVETAYGLENTGKVGLVSKRIAERLGIPAYIVLYRLDRNGKIDMFKTKQLTPVETDWVTMRPDSLAATLVDLRSRHRCGGQGTRRVRSEPVERLWEILP